MRDMAILISNDKLPGLRVYEIRDMDETPMTLLAKWLFVRFEPILWSVNVFCK